MADTLVAPDQPIGRPFPSPDEDLEPNVAAAVSERQDNDALQFLFKNTTPGKQEEERTFLETTGDIAFDVAKGVVETPRAIASGTRDFIQSTLDLTDELADFLETKVPLGRPVLFQDGEFKPGIVKAEPEETGIELPEIAEPASTTGKALESITQFLLGFAGAGKLPGVRSLLGKTPITQAAVKGAVADFTAFDGHEERLANLIEDFPALQNPVTEFLAASPDDTEIEGRLKNAVEGLGLGVGVDGFIKALTVMRAARQARAGLGDVTETAAARSQVPDEDLIATIGDPNADLFISRAIRETETGVPDDVAAAGLVKVTENGGKEFFANFARMDTDDDVKRTIGLMIDAFKPNLEEITGGVQTWQQTQAAAHDIDAFNELLKRPDAMPLNAAQTVAVRELWHSAGQRLTDVAQLAFDNPSAANLFAFRKMMAVFHAIQKEVISVRTETARALNAWKIPVGSPVERFAEIDDLMREFGGEEVSRALAGRVARLGRERGVGAVAKALDKGVLARSLDVVQEYWINSLLSGPKTHIVNSASNSLVIMQSLIERATAAQIGRLLGDTGVEAGEAMAAVHGVRASFMDAFRSAWHNLRTGEREFGFAKIERSRIPAISAQTFNLDEMGFPGRVVNGVGSLVRIPGRLLEAEDEFFKTIGYRMELHGLAFRQATRDLQAGKITPDQFKERMFEVIENPPENIKLSAVDTAQYQTFTNKAGPLTRLIQAGLGKRPAFRFILPFTNTPSNILRYSFERTPLAPLMSTVRQEIAAGGARRQTQLARMAVGSAFSMLAIDLAFNGMLTGSGPDRGSERRTLQRSGWQRYSIMFGDRFFAFNRIDNVGFTLGMAADIAEYVQNVQADSDTGLEVGEMMAALIASIAGNITNKTYFQGLSQAIEAMNDPDRFAEAWVRKFAGSFVPTISREAETFIDPHLRAASDIISTMKSRTPGLSSDLPSVRDMWGRPVSFASGIQPRGVGRVYDLISPIYSRRFKPEPIDKEMLDRNMFIGMPSKRMTFSGVAINLRNRPDVYYRYIELAGNAIKHPEFGMGAKDLLNKIVTGKHELSNEYNILPDNDARENFIRRIIGQYRRLARQQLLEEFPDITEQVSSAIDSSIILRTPE